jgi:hypothetical protein
VAGDNPTSPLTIVDEPPDGGGTSVISEPARIAKLEAAPRFTVAGVAVALRCRNMIAAMTRAILGEKVIFIETIFIYAIYLPNSIVSIS